MKIIHADCMAAMQDMLQESVDAIVTDPPYGLSFMGKKWDYDVPSVDVWRECLRVLKPGGHLLAFAGTRTQHRMACAIEDAGFEIRDMIAWVYGSGFPKSLDVSKAIDKAAGAEREVVGKRDTLTGGNKAANTFMASPRLMAITAPATDAARQWDGWGTALKPALEPITVARKPFQCTVAANLLAHGTGALNVDGCRVGRAADDVSGWSQSGSSASENRAMSGANYARAAKPDAAGRWPANLIHDGSDEVVGLFPEAASGGGNGARRAGPYSSERTWSTSKTAGLSVANGLPSSTGSAARFFYCAKASKRDRDEGLTTPEREAGVKNESGRGFSERDPMAKIMRRNHHPTVKPTALMRYLCRLVTPPGGTVLDPFMGSGSTGKAAILEGFNFIGIERDAEYVEIARARIAHALTTKEMELPLC